MPKILLSAKNGQIPARDQYTAGEIAWLMGVAHRTACKLIDEGLLAGFRLPVSPGARLRERRVHHAALLIFIGKHPEYDYMLDKLTNVPPVVPVPVTQEVPKCKTAKKSKAK